MADLVNDAPPAGYVGASGQGTAFVEGLSVPELGFAAGFALWGFRACARGQVMCCAVIHGFERVFEDDAPNVLATLYALSRVLGTKGRRKISLAAPGCAGVTSDELSLAALFSASQAGDGERRDAHLAWLFAGRAPEAAVRSVDRLGLLFMKHGLTLRSPDLTLSAPPPRAAAELAAYAGGRA